MERVLKIASVLKELKSDLARDVKKAARRTRKVVLYLAAEAQKEIRRSSERESREKNEQTNHLKEELHKKPDL